MDKTKCLFSSLFLFVEICNCYSVYIRLYFSACLVAAATELNDGATINPIRNIGMIEMRSSEISDVVRKSMCLFVDRLIDGLIE